MTFNYDEDEGGDSGQLILAVYNVSEFRVIETYLAHWSEGGGPEFRFDVFAESREEREFAGYTQEGI